MLKGVKDIVSIAYLSRNVYRVILVYLFSNIFSLLFLKKTNLFTLQVGNISLDVLVHRLLISIDVNLLCLNYRSRFCSILKYNQYLFNELNVVKRLKVQLSQLLLHIYRKHLSVLLVLYLFSFHFHFYWNFIDLANSYALFHSNLSFIYYLIFIDFIISLFIDRFFPHFTNWSLAQTLSFIFYTKFK